MTVQDSSYRMNIRIPRRQYELMRKHGAVMGLDTDAACVKYFLTMGLQATAGSLSSVLVKDNMEEAFGKMLNIMQATNDQVKQLDLVEESGDE